MKAEKVGGDFTIRKQQRRRLEPIQDDLVDPGGSIEDEIFRGEIQRRLLLHLQALSLDCRTALVIREVKGHSVEQIAEITGVGVNTVRGRLRRGRRKIRHAVEMDPDGGCLAP